MNKLSSLLMIIIFLVVFLAALFLFTALSGPIVEAGGCPTADRIMLVIPEEQNGRTPECDEISGCIMACFLLPEARGEWEMDCFPWVPRR